MIRRRSSHLWMALWLAVVLPITACGPVFASNLVLLTGQLSPIHAQHSEQSEHEEDPAQSFAKLGATLGLRRRLNCPLPLCGGSISSTLAARQELQDPRRWNSSSVFPSLTWALAGLARRGPPSA